MLVLTGGRASGQAVEIASVAQRLKTPYLVDHPSADIITAKGFEWVFRNNPTGSIYPQAFNKFISEMPGAMPKSAAVIYDNTVFGKTIANSIMTFLKSKNVTIVNDEAYPVNTLDFKPIMTKVKANNPDYVLMVAVSTTDAILLTRHAKEIGLKPRAFVGFGGGFGVADFAKQLGTLSDNVFSSAAWSGNPNDPKTKAFYENVLQEVRHLPEGARGRGLCRDLHHRRCHEAREADRQPRSRPRRDPPGAAQDRHDDGVRQGEVRQLGGPARRRVHEPERLLAGAFGARPVARRQAAQRVAEGRTPRPMYVFPDRHAVTQVESTHPAPRAARAGRPGAAWKPSSRAS